MKRRQGRPRTSGDIRDAQAPPAVTSGGGAADDLPPEGLAEGVNTVLPSLGVGGNIVVGTVSGELLIERVSREAESVLGYQPEELIGQPVLRLVDADDSTKLLRALAQSAVSRRGVHTPVQLRSAHREVKARHLLVHPLIPAPSFAFALLPADDAAAADPAMTSRMLAQLGLGVHPSIFHATAVAVRSDLPGSAKLSMRELEIVTRLLAGDRVPTIAQSLFLSPSTVRNHLSAVFGKLRVHSQQELITLLRKHGLRGPDSSADSDAARAC
jgi:DNA-binding NarL/FixJ family response regulator